MQQGMMRGAVVTMDGMGEWLSVRGHRGIMEYSEHLLRLRLNKGVMRIDGKNLTLESMDGEDILITGRIGGVTLERE